MKITHGALLGTVLTALLTLGGCPPEDFPNAIDATAVEVSAILNDDSLSNQEVREQLLALGLTPQAINGIMSGARTANQFGGDLHSAYDKVVGDQLSTLTPDEIQIYGDAAEEADADDTADLTDAEALAIAQLLTENGLNSSEDVDEFVNSPTSDIPSVIPDGLLDELFVNFDPQDVVDQLP